MVRTLMAALGVWLLLVTTAQALVLYTGPKVGTYYPVGRDIASMADTVKIPVQVIATEGSIDNIRQLGDNRAPAMGIVQSDVLGFLGRAENSVSRNLLQHLQVVMPLYYEEVHVLARKEITSFSQLQGKRVAIGEEGSGHMLTAVNLFSIVNIEPGEVKKLSSEEGVVEVLKGSLDAVIFIGGKPVKLFKNMEDLTNPENRKFALMLQQVHFLPMNDAKFYEEYEPTEITPKDYAFVRGTVPTISVQALLVASDYKRAQPHLSACEDIAKLNQTLRKSLPDLKQKAHPKWREINPDKIVVGWQKSSCLKP